MSIDRVQRIHDNGGRAILYQARFHPLANRMLYKGCFHPVNYERVMALKLPLARWIADRLVMRLRQAKSGGWMVIKTSCRKSNGGGEVFWKATYHPR